MAESSLSVGWPELQQEVGFFLGYGRTIGDWSVVQTALISTIVQSGVRRVYYPPAISESTLAYQWTFLRPTTTLAIVADDGDYDLPDDFGSLPGMFHYPEDENRLPIVRISIGELLDLRSVRNMTDAPRFMAIRYKSSDGSAGQRQEVLFWPLPSDDWTLSYSYEAYSGELSDTYPYPLGGMQLAELYIESCLAVAEQRVNQEAGLHTAEYQTLLVNAVARDSKRGPVFFGWMGNVEPLSPWEALRGFRHGCTGGTYPITYGGVDL